MIDSAPTKPTPEDRRERHFDTSHTRHDLRGRSVRGGATMLVTQVLTVVIGLTGTAALARLLTPSDFGLVAMVAALRELSHFFTDMGLPMATVQRKKINHAQVSTLFWINLSLGVGFGLVFAALAVPVAWFYGDTRLEMITIVSALGIPLGVAGAHHLALLRRQMRFAGIDRINALSRDPIKYGPVIEHSSTYAWTRCWPK